MDFEANQILTPTICGFGPLVAIGVLTTLLCLGWPPSIVKFNSIRSRPPTVYEAVPRDMQSVSGLEREEL